MRKKSLWSVVLVCLVTLAACKHEILDVIDPGNNNPPDAGNSCDPDSVYFVNQVQPIISSNCTMSGCHDDASHKDGVVLTSYSKIMRYVRAGNASGSKLYKVMIETGGDRMPPPPMAPISQAQLALIQTWINQGALNNNCTAACDTSSFNFSTAIKPIIDSRCVGCHNPASLGGGIDLSSYNAVKAIVNSGQLWGSVAAQPGYSVMPKNSSRLSDCQIKQIQKWIDAGALNN
ncbi:MAG: hypothetical protein ACK4E0_00320 [Chitinophagaceae bacterium]